MVLLYPVIALQAWGLRVGRKDGAGRMEGRKEKGSKKRGDEGGLGIRSPPSPRRQVALGSGSKRHRIKIAALPAGSIFKNQLLSFPSLLTSPPSVRGTRKVFFVHRMMLLPYYPQAGVGDFNLGRALTG